MCAARRAVRRAASVVARHQGVPVSAILSPRGWAARRARQVALYLAVTVDDVPVRHVARAEGLAHSGIQRTLARIEDRRDDPEFNAFMDRLEGAYAS